jgi:hypothetical protein
MAGWLTTTPISTNEKAMPHTPPKKTFPKNNTHNRLTRITFIIRGPFQTRRLVSRSDTTPGTGMRVCMLQKRHLRLPKLSCDKKHMSHQQHHQHYAPADYTSDTSKGDLVKSAST